MKIKTILLLIICSIWLVACNGNEETTKTIEIQELINFEEEKPDTLQLISDAKDIKIIEKTFKKAREFGEVDNKVVPQYKRLIFFKSNLFLFLIINGLFKFFASEDIIKHISTIYVCYCPCNCIVDP